MAIFIGTGILAPYSRELHLEHPISVSQINAFLNLPEEYARAFIAVTKCRILSQDEIINNQDEVLLFIAPMGG